jgi:hypothetical protein
MGSVLPWHLAAAYGVAALTMAGARFLSRDTEEVAEMAADA